MLVPGAHVRESVPVGGDRYGGRVSPSERARSKPGGINWKEDKIDGFFPFLKNRLYEKLTTLSDPLICRPNNASVFDATQCTI